MSKSAPSTAFDRELPFLNDALTNPPAWWPGLLSLWSPAGTLTGDLGLRLAIRNGYLNFFRKGQSVAQVRQNGAGHLQWIDMVSLEHVDAATTRLMFWEVKTFDDARIRTRGELPTDKGILAQVDRYRKFLSDPNRATQVCAAYRRCARVLQSLAQSVNAEERLGAELRALAGGKTLVLADQPGLLVALPRRDLPERSKAAWSVHRQKLEDAGLKLRIEEVQALN